MSYTEKELKEELDNKSYEFGFVTDIESEKVPIGLNEDTVKLISSKKNEPKWLLAYRLSYRLFSRGLHMVESLLSYFDWLLSPSGNICRKP